MPSSNVEPPFNPEQPAATYQWFIISIFDFFQWLFLTIFRVIPIATLFQGAKNVIISGKAWFTNIGINMGNVTTVNNFGGTQGLERLERFVSFAALHDSAEQDPDCRCHPGTRQSVLKQLQDWFDNPNATDCIIWLHGPAGAGKSAIAKTIAQTIAHKNHPGKLAATFFFFRSDPGRNDGNRLFPTIAWQLAFSIPYIKDFIVDALDKAPHLPTKAVEAQFDRLMTDSFREMNTISCQMPHVAPVVIIDGIDECSDEQLQQRILAVIGNAVKNCCVPLRFIICSRSEALIEETLDKFKDSTLRIDLATLEDSDRDVEKYLMDNFSEISSKHRLNPTWPGQEIIQEIVLKSSGNFILASTLLKFISDEDFSPEAQLDIIRNLTPPGKKSPFAILDQLYLEILKRQPDQGFLKTFLALLLGRSFIGLHDLYEDDATLMDVSERGLHIKLRRMRSLLKFKPFIDVYHKSFFDFLQDSSRSGEYHVSKQAGLKQYLELIVASVVRHVSMVIEQPQCHETCPSPKFKSVIREYPPKIVLPVEDWQDALKPLLALQVKLLKASRPHQCHVTQAMRDLQLHLVILQGKSHTTAQALELNMNETVTERGPFLVTKAHRSIPEKDLDSGLSVLLSCLQKPKSELAVDMVIIDCIASLSGVDCAEIVARIQSVTDAQKLIDIIDLVTNNESFLSKCNAGVVCNAARLGAEIFARVPLLPLSPFLNKPGHCLNRLGYTLEVICQSTYISRILDHNYVLPVLSICVAGDELVCGCGNIDEPNEFVDEWLERSSPDFITRIRVMRQIAWTIRYIHSMDVVLHSNTIESQRFALDSDLRVKIQFMGLFASNYGYEDDSVLANFTFESNISAFAKLFHSMCFGGHNENLPHRLVKDARQLIKQCRTKGPSQLTMKAVVKKMEGWDLT